MAKADKKAMEKGAPASGIYFLGAVGAAIHFVGLVDGFWEVILALLKACVWPAFLINRIFDLLRI